jgi:hypothetical protein
MVSLRKSIALFIIYFFQIFVACKNHNNSQPHKYQDSVFQFRFKPPDASVYSYTTKNETNISQTVNENKIESETEMNIGLSYQVKKDTSNLYNITMTYDKFNVRIKSNDNETEADAENAAALPDPSMKVFGAFKNATLHIQTDNKSNVKKIEGLDKIIADLRILANGDPEALEMVNGSIKQYTDPSTIKTSFEQMFKLLPDKPLHEGDEWTVDAPIGTDLQLNTKNTYKVESIEDGVVKIISNADINLKDQTIVIENNRVRSTLKGSQTGEIQIETATGMLISSSTKLKVSGDLVVMDLKVPVKFSIFNKINRTK